MKKLPDEIRLKRGIQVLLNSNDQNDLRKMAEQRGTSLSGVIRSFVQDSLEDWRVKEKGKWKK
ncbi:MAG: hypothetical protein ABI210_03870 [Abditibacteriaceae bacterium]